MRYEFGQNWNNYIQKHFSEERLAISQKKLLDFIATDSLEGKTFLDIGSGSGLHSYAAFKSGAKKIHSFDYDEDSVRTTKLLWEKAGKPENWTIEQGSVLDEGYLKSLGQFDIVYSWGVLHHTGDQWAAIRNATIPLHDNSVFFIALYASEPYKNPSCDYWLDIKQKYNTAGPLKRKMMECSHYYKNCLVPDLREKRNPLSRFKDYKKGRGMSLWTDIKDWLGGWPMEFSSTKEVFEFSKDELSLDIVKIKMGEACSEYLLMPKARTEQAQAYTLEDLAKADPFNIEADKIIVQKIEEQLKKQAKVFLFPSGKHSQWLSEIIKEKFSSNQIVFVDDTKPSNSNLNGYSLINSMDLLEEEKQGLMLSSDCPSEGLLNRILDLSNQNFINPYEGYAPGPYLKKAY